MNHLDIAPRYASITMGLSSLIGTIAGLLCPLALDRMTRERVCTLEISAFRCISKRFHLFIQTPTEWARVFILAGAIQVFGVIFYAIFASGEKQKWAEPVVANETMACDKVVTEEERPFATEQQSERVE